MPLHLLPSHLPLLLTTTSRPRQTTRRLQSQQERCFDPRFGSEARSVPLAAKITTIGPDGFSIAAKTRKPRICANRHSEKRKGRGGREYCKSWDGKTLAPLLEREKLWDEAENRSNIPLAGSTSQFEAPSSPFTSPSFSLPPTTLPPSSNPEPISRVSPATPRSELNSQPATATKKRGRLVLDLSDDEDQAPPTPKRPKIASLPEIVAISSDEDEGAPRPRKRRPPPPVVDFSSGEAPSQAKRAKVRSGVRADAEGVEGAEHVDRPRSKRSAAKLAASKLVDAALDRNAWEEERRAEKMAKAARKRGSRS